MKSIECNFDNPKVNELLINHFIELSSVSPVDRGHVLDISGLKNLRIKFWSLWENDELIGCGALKFLDKEHSELKSIRVADRFRRKGNGIKVHGESVEKEFEQAKQFKVSAMAKTLADMWKAQKPVK